MDAARFDAVVRGLAAGPSRRSLLRGAAGALLAGVFGARIRPAAAARTLYPDARPRAYGEGPEGGFRPDFAWGREGGRRVLRFSTAVWNAGPGPVEVRGTGLFTADEAFFQILYDDAGGHQRRRLPRGVVEYHPAHGHWHFNDWVHSELFRLGGDGRRQPLGISNKTSFCLMDGYPVTDYHVPPVPGMPDSAVYTTCEPERQGLSVGWVDMYPHDLPGQWFVLGDEFLPKGSYLIRSVVDPKNVLAEGSRRREASSASYCFRVDEASNIRLVGCPQGSPT